MNHSLKKSEILSNKMEISRLFDRGQWSKGRYVNIVSLPSEERRMLFAVARHIKGAVHRNRGKRYLRETYRNNKEWFSSLRTYGLILKKMPLDRDSEKIRLDIRGQLQND
jgi:ribonuclease P protein component